MRIGNKDTIELRCSYHNAPLRPDHYKILPHNEYAYGLLEMEPGNYWIAYDFLTCQSEDNIDCTKHWSAELRTGVDVH